jgi:hypothetical protein
MEGHGRRVNIRRVFADGADLIRQFHQILSPLNEPVLADYQSLTILYAAAWESMRNQAIVL